MTKYTFESAKFNGRQGWLVTRYIDSVYAGKQFVTQKSEHAAHEAFSVVYSYH